MYAPRSAVLFRRDVDAELFETGFTGARTSRVRVKPRPHLWCRRHEETGRETRQAGDSESLRRAEMSGNELNVAQEAEFSSIGLYVTTTLGASARLATAESLICRQFCMGRTGIEPVTLGLKVPCSTN